MTEGERLIEEGRRQGFAIGKLQARAEGRAEVAAKALLSLLESRGTRLTKRQQARIKGTRDPDLLLGWFEEALSGRTAEEILRARSRR